MPSGELDLRQTDEQGMLGMEILAWNTKVLNRNKQILYF